MMEKGKPTLEHDQNKVVDRYAGAIDDALAALARDVSKNDEKAGVAPAFAPEAAPESSEEVASAE
jgi:hypothetical protein